jgi:hypothetical protein
VLRPGGRLFALMLHPCFYGTPRRAAPVKPNAPSRRVLHAPPLGAALPSRRPHLARTGNRLDTAA